MQYNITNKDAGLFAKTFYEEIRKGSPVDEAVRAGREVLGQNQDKTKSFGDRRFGTPVVYFQEQSREPIIDVRRSKPPHQSAGRPTSVVATEEIRICPRCRGKAKDCCGDCGLRFRCAYKNEKGEECREEFLNPLTQKFCVKCQTAISQIPYKTDELVAAAAPVTAAASGFEVVDPGRLDQLSPKGGDIPKGTGKVH
jgi:hypothetical protein